MQFVGDIDAILFGISSNKLILIFCSNFFNFIRIIFWIILLYNWLRSMTNVSEITVKIKTYIIYVHKCIVSNINIGTNISYIWTESIYSSYKKTKYD